MQRYELDWDNFDYPKPLARGMVADDEGEWYAREDVIALAQERDKLKAKAAALTEEVEVLREELSREMGAMDREVRRAEQERDELRFYFEMESARVAELAQECDELRAAAKAYREIAVCLRIGKRPTLRLFRQLDKAKALLGEEEAE